ncbi:hypothetical protein ACFL53_00495 [Pseudomonadota bacterium]
MLIHSMYYPFRDIFFCAYDLTTLSLSMLFVIASLASGKITHIAQAIILASIAIYDSFSVIPTFTYLSMCIMSLSAPPRIWDVIQRGTITNPVIIKFLLLFSIVIIIIFSIMVLGMLGFFAASILKLDPTFDLFGGPHNCLRP